MSPDIPDVLTGSGAKQFAATVGVLVGVLVGLYLLGTLVGPIAAVIYVFLFLFTLTVLPVSIGLFAGATPNVLGKGHLILGAVAYNHHYLVQREHGWEWCPGDEDRIWIDGEWHSIEGGFENKSVFGWRPFGICRFKDDETWKQQRVDTKAKRLRGVGETDGGEKDVQRGGFQQADDPLVSGVDGTWLLDLKRVYTRGIRKIGDIELIETAEEVIERGQVDDGRMGGFGPIVETFAFMALGVATGIIYILIA